MGSSLQSVKSDIERAAQVMLPEKYSLEVMQDCLDVALTAGVNKMRTILTSDDVTPKDKIGSMNALTNLGRYMEIRIVREIQDDDKKISESITDLLDDHE